jgi:hypothetical protein
MLSVAHQESSYSMCNGSDLGEKNAKDALCSSQKAPNQQKLVSSYPFSFCAISHWFSVILSIVVCGFFQHGRNSSSHLQGETKKGVQPKSEAQHSLRKEASTDYYFQFLAHKTENLEGIVASFDL